MIDSSQTAAVRLCLALADEMTAMRGMIETMATVLIADPAVLALYGTELQGFDLLAQRAMESAELLIRIAGGMDAEEAVAAIRLERMQQRLSAALTAA